jgi:hypothetical protein
VLLAQQLAHVAGEGIEAGLAQVAAAHQGRVEAGRGAHGRDHRQAQAQAGGQEVQLGLDVVDGVDDQVGLGGEQALGGRGGVELGAGVDRRVGIDEAQPLGHDRDLALAQGPLHGVQLAVRVGHADAIEVDQDDATDAGADQGLGGVTADPAAAEDRDRRAAEASERVVADETGSAVEAAVRHGAGQCSRRTRRALAVVRAAIASAVVPRAAARPAMTSTTKAGSLRCPAWAAGGSSGASVRAWWWWGGTAAGASTRLLARG